MSFSERAWRTARVRASQAIPQSAPRIASRAFSAPVVVHIIVWGSEGVQGWVGVLRARKARRGQTAMPGL